MIGDVFRNRWRTLMSVDDLVAGLAATAERLGVLDETYFFYTSDHGFQLGEFNILMDKRLAYDWDTRVHCVVRGRAGRRGAAAARPR